MDHPATCVDCGAAFTVPAQLRERFPGWTPARCRRCHPARGTGPGGRGERAAGGPSVADVLATHRDGPKDGVFTDGSADPNPGPGGWGAVYVVDDQVVDEAWGHEPQTTNNRMELTALIAGIDLVPAGTPATAYSDSRLVVDTATKWAATWARNGWKRKSGPVQNLDLVQALHQRLTDRPEIEVAWVKAHAGVRWNEYADALSTAYLRDRR